MHGDKLARCDVMFLPDIERVHACIQLLQQLSRAVATRGSIRNCEHGCQQRQQLARRLRQQLLEFDSSGRGHELLQGEACVHLVDDQASAPNVVGIRALVAAGCALQRLGRQVPHGAFDHACLGRRVAQHERGGRVLLVHHFGQAEVSKLDLSVAVVDSGAVGRQGMALQQHVLRFDVPVQPLHLVAQVNESLQQLPREAQHGGCRKTLLRPTAGSVEMLRQVAACNHLHLQGAGGGAEDGVEVEHPVYLYDVLVLGAQQLLAFAHGCLSVLGVIHQLHGNETLLHGVLALVHRAKAALAQFAHHLEVQLAQQ